MNMWKRLPSLCAHPGCAYQAFTRHGFAGVWLTQSFWVAARTSGARFSAISNLGDIVSKVDLLSKSTPSCHRVHLEVERGIFPKLASMPGGLNVLKALQKVEFTDALGNKNDLLNRVGVSFRLWCKNRRLEKPPCCWNLHMIGRQDTGNAYPTLESSIKAAHTKPILFFLSDLATQIAAVCTCCLSGFERKLSSASGSTCQQRALMLWGVCDYLFVVDRPANFLGEELRARAFKAGMTSLLNYAALSSMNLAAKRVNYKLRPKWHAWCHMVHGLQFSDENCRQHKTLSEEDMLGKLTKMASACHGAAVIQRFFQRFGLFLGLHWERIEASKDEVEER